MLSLVVLLSLAAAAALCLPRRQRLSGVLFIALGVWSVVLRFTTPFDGRHVPLGIALGAGVVWFALGIRILRLRTA